MRWPSTVTFRPSQTQPRAAEVGGARQGRGPPVPRGAAGQAEGGDLAEGRAAAQGPGAGGADLGAGQLERAQAGEVGGGGQRLSPGRPDVVVPQVEGRQVG